MDDDTSGNIDVTFMYWMKNSFIVVLSKFALHSKYWSQKLSKASDGSTVLTTSYRFPSSMTVDKQPTSQNCKFIVCLQMQN